jgi:hypothetical protein
VTSWEESSGRAVQPASEFPEEAGHDTDDAIDKAKRDVDAEAEEAARQSGYADRGESEDAASDR